MRGGGGRRRHERGGAAVRVSPVNSTIVGAPGPRAVKVSRAPCQARKLGTGLPRGAVVPTMAEEQIPPAPPPHVVTLLEDELSKALNHMVESKTEVADHLQFIADKLHEAAAAARRARQLKLLEKPAVSSPPSADANIIVLTGGPGCGKTTLLHELKARGYPVLGEAAASVMEPITEVLDDGKGGGPDGQLQWRTRNGGAFNDLLGMAGLRQMDKALAALPAGQWLFMDRTPLDAYGYTIARGFDLPACVDPETNPELLRSVLGRVAHVWVLDAIEFDVGARNAATGRKTDPAKSKKLSAALHTFYSGQKVPTAWLPGVSVSERVDLVLAKLPAAAKEAVQAD